MIAISLIQKAKKQGVTHSLQDGKVRANWDGPEPKDLFTELRQHKAALLSYLKTQGLTVDTEVSVQSAQVASSPSLPATAPAPLAALPPLWREDLCRQVTVARRTGYTLADTTRFLQSLFSQLSTEQIQTTYDFAGISELADDYEERKRQAILELGSFEADQDQAHTHKEVAAW